jgi:hypothetical protein
MTFLKRILGLKKTAITLSEKNDLMPSETPAICPYCNQILIKFPSRKTKCKHCNNIIFIIKSNENNQKILSTEKQFNLVETLNSNEYFKNRWIKVFEGYGITEVDFNSQKTKLDSTQLIRNNDVFWSLFNSLLFNNANNPSLLSNIYYDMAIFLLDEGKKDNFKFLQLSARSKLDSFNSDLEFKIQINGNSDSCENCNKHKNKIISLEEAYTLPIPCKDCTHGIGFCRCYYTPINIRDLDGNLVFKKE